MQIHRFSGKLALSVILACLFVATSSFIACASSVVEFTAIGKVESIYRGRVTMRIFEMIGSATAELSVRKGSWVSFDLPKKIRERNERQRRPEVNFGTIIKVALIGNVATEYELKDKSEIANKTDITGDSNLVVKDDNEIKTGSTVLLWTAQSVVKLKNRDARKYNEAGDKKDEKKRGRKYEKDKKEKEAVKIWTQQETIRGIVVVSKELVYIKEERLGRKDHGLQITSKDWNSKLREYEGCRVVAHGTTHRTSISSGTVEIENVMKVYPK